jgi:hypothetical protein
MKKVAILTAKIIEAAGRAGKARNEDRKGGDFPF